MDQRMMTNRIPSSMTENDQSSIEPNAMGVKTRRKIMMNLIIE
jgi:hypothetical protein